MSGTQKLDFSLNLHSNAEDEKKRSREIMPKCSVLGTLNGILIKYISAPSDQQIQNVPSE